VIPPVMQHYINVGAQSALHGYDARQTAGGVVGQRKALATAVRNRVSRRRWAKLRENLGGIQNTS
jgi:hypothetical protein